MNSTDSNLGFLLADVSRLMRRQFQKRLEGNTLTFAQARVLLHLSRSPGMRQVELAEILEMQPISLIRVIDPLQEQGLLERRADPTDRRAYQLFLTPAATPHLQAIKSVADSLRGDVLGSLSEQETVILHDVLNRLRTKLSSQT